MQIKPIRTRADHQRAVVEIGRLMGARRGTPQADRLEAWDIPTDILVQPYRLDGQRSSRAA